jgi:hypothetical protein
MEFGETTVAKTKYKVTSYKKYMVLRGMIIAFYDDPDEASYTSRLSLNAIIGTRNAFSVFRKESLVS